ncbi:MAG TPA: hypothetical protein DF613_06235 [Lachnospiraceae bacterium]|nr:hypothetical protein [Lachnospiraceae bacterium]
MPGDAREDKEKPDGSGGREIHMTEIKAGEVTVNGHIALGDFIISDRELENLYAYLEEKRRDREQELTEVTRKAGHMEARNHDLDRLAGMLEEM